MKIISKAIALMSTLPMLISASGSHYSEVFNYSRFSFECVQEGKLQNRLISNDNTSIVCDVNLTYEMYKLPIYAPYTEKHQTYWFTYSVEIYLYGEGYYKNGLGNWFTEAFNSHLEQGKNVYSNVYFSDNVGDAVFYSMARNGLSKTGQCKPIKNFRNNLDYSKTGSGTQAFSQYYVYFYKYLESGDYVSDGFETSSLFSNDDFETFWAEISGGDPIYSDNIFSRSESDYSVAYNFFNYNNFLDGKSHVIGVDRDLKEDLSIKFYDQFCIDSNDIRGAAKVTIKPSFTIIEGNNTWYDNCTFQYNEPFDITLNFN